MNRFATFVKNHRWFRRCLIVPVSIVIAVLTPPIVLFELTRAALRGAWIDIRAEANHSAEEMSSLLQQLKDAWE